MPSEHRIGPAENLPPGKVVPADGYAVGNAAGSYFAVSKRCRHWAADLSNGTVDRDGCLVCPWHGARYDVETGRMVRGPQGVFEKIPGLNPTLKALTRAYPLRRREVVERDGTLFLDA